MVEQNGVELTEQEKELYDRQIRLWGLESQKRLRAAKILISGLNGLGAEIAKNIILAGVKSVILNDSKSVTEADKFSQFLVSVDDIGKNRAESSLQRARALNPTVEITADTEPLTEKSEEFFSELDVVVVVGACIEVLCYIDKVCRSTNTKFFCGDVWGMFGYAFTDLNTHEFVEDIYKHKIVSESNEKIKTEIVTTTVKRSIQFPDFTNLLRFKFEKPEYMKRIKRFGPWFVVMRTLQLFRDKFKRDPHYATRDDDYKKLLKFRDRLTSSDITGDELFVNVFNQISPVAAIVGGEISQEIIKAVSQKEAPHKNVFLFNPDTCCGFIDLIEEEEEKEDEEEKEKEKAD